VISGAIRIALPVFLLFGLAAAVFADQPAAAGNQGAATISQNAGLPLLPCFSSEVDGDYAPLTMRPRKCHNAGYETPNSAVWTLINVRWDTWKATEARGSGYRSPTHFYPGLEDPRYRYRPVKITAYGISSECGDDHPIFTRIKVSAGPWKERFRRSLNARWKTKKLPAYRQVLTTYAPDC